MHDKFVNFAIEYAKESVKNGGYPFGAVIVKNGEIVGDSRTRKLNTGALNHAETNAIINACENLNIDNLTGCILYSSCRPCGFCMGAIKWIGIKEIYYVMDESDAKSIGHLDDIFADESIQIYENKIPKDDFVNYVKSWYDKL